MTAQHIPLCIKCGAECERRKSEGVAAWQSRKYCSPVCYGRAKDLSLPRERDCPVCATRFSWPAGVSATQWRKRRYCSPECARTTYSSIRNQQWANAEYRQQMSKAHNPGQPNGRAGIPVPNLAGPKNKNWKGGITPVFHKIRTSMLYQQWRKKVLERDGFRCVMCGFTPSGGAGGHLHVDHIKSFAHHPDLRLDVNNGRTLCGPCHRKTDTFAGRANRR